MRVALLVAVAVTIAGCGARTDADTLRDIVTTGPDGAIGNYDAGPIDTGPSGQGEAVDCGHGLWVPPIDCDLEDASQDPRCQPPCP